MLAVPDGLLLFYWYKVGTQTKLSLPWIYKNDDHSPNKEELGNQKEKPEVLSSEQKKK